MAKLVTGNERELGYRPRVLEEGIRELAGWLRGGVVDRAGQAQAELSRWELTS